MPPEDSSLVVHLRSCAASCLHGAGSSLPAVGRLPLRRVRRWLLAYLQQDGRAHLTELSDALAHLAPETACDWRESVLRRACRALQSEGRAVYRAVFEVSQLAQRLEEAILTAADAGLNEE
ncbi:unnamed protein product, partial [Symbiodinium microadriaticum]